MESISLRRCGALLGCAALLVAMLPTAVTAQDVRYTACLTKTGELTNVAQGGAPAQPCGKRGTEVWWNGVGAEGPRGETGARGARGPQGKKGERGARGPEGPVGPRGPEGVAGVYLSAPISQSITPDSMVAWGTVQCAGGDYAIGVSYRVDERPMDADYVVLENRRQTPRNWLLSVHNTGAGTLSFEHQTLCLDLSP